MRHINMEDTADVNTTHNSPLMVELASAISKSPEILDFNILTVVKVRFYGFRVRVIEKPSGERGADLRKWCLVLVLGAIETIEQGKVLHMAKVCQRVICPSKSMSTQEVVERTSEMVEEGCTTPRSTKYRIPMSLVSPLPPRKKSMVVGNCYFSRLIWRPCSIRIFDEKHAHRFDSI
ncbi:hypothetical protein HID58_013529 [Brassica napus]|uniref:Uncharacterized protein n=1 Tax=Brassica napus TaxID=3708 RepID=A0ABQ8E4T8_BRANA|nr:hypothetical protein HID58_013529 [Brassica napus]